MDEALLLRFKSDDTINSKGFSAAYVVIEDGKNFDYDYDEDDSEEIVEEDDDESSEEEIREPREKVL